MNMLLSAGVTVAITCIVTGHFGPIFYGSTILVAYLASCEAAK